MEGKEIQKINNACESLKEKIWMLELERDEAQRELKSEKTTYKTMPVVSVLTIIAIYELTKKAFNKLVL